MTSSFQKPSNCNFVDNLVVLVVDSLESSSNTERLVFFQVLFQLLETEFKVNFLCEKNCEFLLNHHVEVFIRKGATRGSLSYICAQVNIHTGKNDRHKAISDDKKALDTLAWGILVLTLDSQDDYRRALLDRSQSISQCSLSRPQANDDNRFQLGNF